MSSKHPDIFAALVAPFAKEEVKTRSQAGRQFSYVTARVVMNRLDEVLGAENWWDSYLPLEHSILCTLTIRLPDGREISKQDAGGHAGMTDMGDDEKSGFSDAFKRAAVKFGVGRYLYRDGVPSYRQTASKPADFNAWCEAICGDINEKWATRAGGSAGPLVHPTTMAEHLTRWAGPIAKSWPRDIAAFEDEARALGRTRWLDAKAKADADAAPKSKADKLAETLKARGKDSKPTPAPAGREPGQEG